MMTTLMRYINQIVINKGKTILWASLLIALPITSFPLFRELGFNSVVSPLAVIPLIPLVVLWLPKTLWQQGKIPQDVLLILIFAAFALLSCLIAVFIPILPYKQMLPMNREIRALLTLAVGISFFILTAYILDDEKILRLSLRMINIGAIVMMIWALIQVWIITCHSAQYPVTFLKIHRLISIRDPVFARVSGMAFEPSWLANQFSLLYFPIWIGAITHKVSAHKKWGWFSLEMILLVVGVFLVFMAKSRIGLFSIIALLGFLAVWLAYRFSTWVNQQIRGFFLKKKYSANRLLFAVITIAIWILILLLLLLLVYAALYMAKSIDHRLEFFFTDAGMRGVLKNFDYLFSYDFAKALRFSERQAYWEAGIGVFERYPLMGIGLGNAGFLFPETVPTWGWRAPEVANALRTSTSIFPNSKSMWIRLLAETGVVGFSLFVTWLLLMALQAVKVYKSRPILYRSIGFAGLLGLVTMVVEGFSMDTFGLPYFWIILGIVSAAYRLNGLRAENV